MGRLLPPLVKMVNRLLLALLLLGDCALTAFKKDLILRRYHEVGGTTAYQEHKDERRVVLPTKHACVRIFRLMFRLSQIQVLGWLRGYFFLESLQNSYSC